MNAEKEIKEEVVWENKQEQEVNKPTELEQLINNEQEKVYLAKEIVSLRETNKELKQMFDNLNKEFNDFKSESKKITINEAETKAIQEIKTEEKDPVKRWNELYSKNKIN